MPLVLLLIKKSERNKDNNICIYINPDHISEILDVDDGTNTPKCIIRMTNGCVYTMFYSASDLKGEAETNWKWWRK